MPGPPPPPPMAPAAPPPPTFSLPKASNDRGALLNSIRQGTKLKKTVTVDKSGPMIPGKSSNASNSNSNLSMGNSIANHSVQSTPNGLPLGGLFAGGMPKLKPVGRLGSLNSSNSNHNNNNNSPEIQTPKIQASKNFSSVQDQLKRQLHSPSDTRTRGPPPPAPTRNISTEESKAVKQSTFTDSSINGLYSSQTSIQANSSSLHYQHGRKSKSNVNLVSLDNPDGVSNSGFQSTKLVINHGKPNLAPKPPTSNGKPAPPLKLSLKPNKPISRAQSMRSPRSPSPQSPSVIDANIKFGTVRNISSLLGPALSQGSQPTNRQRPALATRPSVPPPSVPPPTPKLSVVKPPNHAPPPPPGGIPQPPSAPPPPPPHKTQSITQPVRPPPAIPISISNINPPPPPPRNSSMKDANQPRSRGVDLDKKFEQQFATIDRFPRPPTYRNVLKLYSNSQESSC